MIKETKTATVIAGCIHQRSLRNVRSAITAREFEKTPVFSFPESINAMG
jgi:hypothetical protein